MAGGIILSLTYGIEVQDDDDPFVNLIESANENFNAATVPGAFMVDFFPSLLLLPEWLPGMSFKALARTWAKATQAMVDVPYTYTKKQMVGHVLFIHGLHINDTIDSSQAERPSTPSSPV